jgi:uncharacterized protein involved in outer membrane biogenesis
MAPRRKITTVLAVTAVVLIAILLVGRLLINADRYRTRVISYLQKKTGKPVEIGKLSLTFFPLAISVENFALRNTPPFPSGYVVKVKRIDARLDPRQLLHRHVVITSLVLDTPEVNPTSDPDGPWNFANPNARPSDKPFTLGEIAKVEIRHGQLVASNLLPSNAPGPVFLEAHEIFGELDHVNVDAVIDPGANSMGGQGRVRAERLSFGAVDGKNVAFTLQLWAKQAFLADVKAEACGGLATGALFFDLTGKRPAFRMNAKFSDIDIVAVLQPFENGRGRMTGQMEGDLTLAGQILHTHRPLAGIHGNGHVTLRSGRVPSLALNENLMRLVKFNNQGPAKDNPASFNRISTDLELTNLRISSKTIDIDGYGVDVDAAGNVNVDGSDEIDYYGVARITTKQGFFTSTFARFAGATLKDGLLSFPFKVSGTIGAPVFAKSSGNAKAQK